MLVLRRDVNQSIVMTIEHPDGLIEIDVIVTGIIGQKARIGINAPQSVRINRHEIHEGIVSGALVDIRKVPKPVPPLLRIGDPPPRPPSPQLRFAD